MIRKFALALTFLSMLLGFSGTEAHGQPAQFAGTTPVGASSSNQSVSVTLPLGGSVATVKVLTQGAAGLDFVNAGGGTCVAGATFLPTQQCSVNVGFSPTSPGMRHGAIVLLDGSGKTLGSQLVLGAATGPVGVFVPGTINTVAGQATWIYSGDGNPASQSSVFLPFGIALDGAGNLYIADSGNTRIRKVDGATGLMGTVAGYGVIGSNGDGGQATGATLNNPTSIALDPAGNLFFSDSGNNVVRRVDAFTGIITTFAGTIGQHGYTGDTGAAKQATLNTPNGLAFDNSGNLYIADTGNSVIRLVNAQTLTISTVAGTGIPHFGGDGGPATSAGLSSPWSIALSGTGELYIADQNNNRIRKVNLSGIISTIIGDGVAGFGGDNGVASLAEVNVPANVVFDVAGNLYVSDSGNNRIRKVNAGTNIITTIAGTNDEGYDGDTNRADLAGLYGPYTLALDGQGSLFLADVFHNRVRKISSNAAVLNYKPQRVGRVSAAQSQLLENDGNAALNPSGIIAVSNSQVDPTTTTCAPGAPMAPLATCVIGGEFAPTVTGNPVLGTINVNSDASNSPGIITLSGQVLDTDPTTVTLSSSQNPSVTGQPVIFSVVVTSAGSTPTGTVNLLDGTNPIGSAQLGAGGNAQFSAISNLTGGQHTMTAAYAGDASNSTGVSAPLIQTVHDPQAATTTTLASSGSPVIAGATVALTASVSLTTAGSGSGAITGTVSYKEGSTILGTAAVNGPSAVLNITTLSVGTHTIIATYNGSSSYLSSSSSAITEVIVIATSKTTISSATNPSFSGAPVSLSATVTSNGGVPGGAVVFMDGSKSLGTANLNAMGVATLSVPGTNWTTGSHNLTANYGGDPSDTASNSSPITQLVTIASTSVTLASSLNPSGLGALVTFTATVTGNGGAPSGAVQFLDGSGTIGSGTLDANGNASFATSLLTVGSHNITAVYSGDNYDSNATSAALIQSVQQTTIGVTLASSGNPSNFGSPLTFTANVTGTGSAPTGTVTFQDGSTAIGSGTLSASGVATFTTSTLAIGSHSIVAVYSGDANHASVSSAALTESIVQATTTSLATTTPAITAGLNANLTATVTGAQGKSTTGLVTFTDNGAVLVALPTDANGNAVLNTTMLAVGTHSIVAKYPGDSLDGPSTSQAVTIVVTIAGTSTTLTTSANPIFAGATLALNSTVTGNGAIPTGNLSFMDGNQVLTTVALSATGTASFSTAILAPGIHQLTARYVGDANDGPSVSANIAEQVAQHTSVTLASSANPSLLTDNVTITVTVGNSTAAPPTGAVTLTDGANPFGTSLVDASGIATFTLNAPSLGQHALVANYAGDNANSPAASAPLLQNVVLRPTTTSFTPSATALTAGQQIVLVSVVQGSGNKPVTGQVTFQSGSTIFGTAQLSASGVATLSLQPAQGVYAAVAQYSGDSLYAPSTSPAIAITVGPTVEFTFTMTPPNLTVQSGSHTTMQINITSAPTFSDTLALGCAGLPAYTTCTFSTNQIPLAGGAPQSLTVTVDTGDPLGAGPTVTAQLTDNRAMKSLACFLPAGALLALLFGRRSRRTTRGLGLLLMLLLLGGSTILSGCGSSFTQQATSAGNYTFQIVGTGDTTGATQTGVVKLTVTK